MDSKPSGVLAPTFISLTVTGLLWWTMERALGSAEIALDFALLRPVKDFDRLEWALLLVATLASTIAISRRKPLALLQIQAWSLGACLLVTQYRLGSEIGKKVDWRIARALVSGVAGLHCCYVCLLAQLVLGVWSLVERHRATQT